MRFWFLILTFLCLGTSGSWSKELVVALADTDYPPFYYVNPETKALEGVSIDICETMAQELGHTLTYRRMPFARLIHNLSAGEVDMACTLFNTSGRAPGITYTSVPHVFEEVWLVYKKDHPIPTSARENNYADYQIGGIRGYYYGKLFSAHPDIDLLLVQNEEQLVRTLIAGRVNGILGNRSAINLYAMKEQIAEQLEYYPLPVFRGPIFMAFSRERDDTFELAADFTTALVNFMKTDAYKSILKSYDISSPVF